MTRKISILKTKDIYDDYGDRERIIEKITDFVEVDDATYNLLRAAQRDMGFSIVEIPLNVQTFVLETVADYKELIEQRQEEARKARDLADEKRRKDSAKRKAAQEAKEKETLAELLRKHGPVTV